MERLKELRKRLHLRQSDIADILGIKQASYSSIEIGRNILTERNAEVLSNKLGVNKDWLLTGEGEMFDPNIPQSDIRLDLGEGEISRLKKEIEELKNENTELKNKVISLQEKILKLIDK